MNMTEYKLIPMSEITDEARELAVLWSENMKDDFISQKHKLASDIMNYAESLAKERAVEFAYECLKSMYESIGYSYGIPFMEGKVKEFTEILGKDYDTFLAEKRKEGAE